MSEKNTKQSGSNNNIQLSLDFLNVPSNSIIANNNIQNEGAKIISMEPRRDVYRRILNRLTK